MRTWKSGLWGVALMAVGCPRQQPPVVDAGPPMAVVDAGPVVPLAIDLEVALSDGGTERHALLGLETPLVSPGQHLVVESNRPLHNARIRILDEADRVLESDDAPEETATALRYRVELLRPLESGHKYAVL